MLHDIYSRKLTAKTIYDVKLTEKEFQDGPKKGVYELSNKPATAPTTINRRLREDVYEDPDQNMATTTTSASRQGGAVAEDTYETVEINTTQGAGEDNKPMYTYVNTRDNATTTVTAVQGGGVQRDLDDMYEVPDHDTPAILALSTGGGGVRDDMYEVPDHDIVDTRSATLAIPGGGCGVRESVYDEPDNPGAAAPLMEFQLTECLAYGETT